MQHSQGLYPNPPTHQQQQMTLESQSAHYMGYNQPNAPHNQPIIQYNEAVNPHQTHMIVPQGKETNPIVMNQNKKKKRGPCYIIACGTVIVIGIILLILILVGASVAIAWAASCRANHVRETPLSYDLSSISKLVIKGSGNIKLHKGNHGSEMYGTVTVRSRKEGDYTTTLTTDPNNSSILILETKRNRDWAFTCEWIERMVYLPDDVITSNMHLEIYNEYSDIITPASETFEFASVQLQSKTGDVNLGKLKAHASMDLSIGTGSFKVANLEAGSGGIKMKTTTGSVKVEKMITSGQISAESRSGDVKLLLIEQASSITAKTSSGFIEVKMSNFEGAFDMKVFTGTIKIRNDSGKTMVKSQDTETVKRGYIAIDSSPPKLVLQSTTGDIKADFL